MLERELALYRTLQKHRIRTTFVTYGDKSDLPFAAHCQGGSVCCNRFGLPTRLYQMLIPLLHGADLIRCDVIKTNQAKAGIIAARTARMLGKPLVVRCGYMWSEFEARQAAPSKAQHARRVENHLFEAAEQVVVTSEEMRRDVKNRGLSLSRSPAVIPNYVDTELFCPQPEVHKNYDIMFLGRLENQKNIGALVGALRKLRVRTLLVGDGGHRDQVMDLLSDLGGLGEWRKSVSHEELPALFNSTKVFLLPSLYEGHPKALIEAMACGCAVVAADAPGINTLVEHEKTGILCGLQEDDIMDAVSALLHNTDRRSALAKKAREAVEAQFALSKVALQEADVLLRAGRRESVEKIREAEET